jgi:GT2 family glycosyltransferase
VIPRLLAGAAAPGAGRYDADILILVLDRTEETIAAIRSAQAQTGVRTHIFILDQGSQPHTLHRVAEVVRESANVTLLGVTENLGVAGGRNLISGLGHGRVLVALDNDAEFESQDTVRCMVAALDAEPRLGAVGCRIVRHDDGTDDLSSWGYPGVLLPSAAGSFDAVTYVGAGHAIRRAAWEQAGGYDAKLFFCWEEFDFCLRAIALGWRIRYRGDIVIRHKVSSDRRVHWTAGRWFYFVRNRLYIERKLDRRGLALVPRMLGYLVKGTRNGMPLQTLRAIRAAAVMAPRASPGPLSADARSYLISNDRQHRGSWLRRLRHEALGRIRA